MCAGRPLRCDARVLPKTCCSLFCKIQLVTVWLEYAWHFWEQAGRRIWEGIMLCSCTRKLWKLHTQWAVPWGKKLAFSQIAAAHLCILSLLNLKGCSQYSPEAVFNCLASITSVRYRCLPIKLCSYLMRIVVVTTVSFCKIGVQKALSVSCPYVVWGNDGCWDDSGCSCAWGQAACVAEPVAIGHSRKEKTQWVSLYFHGMKYKMQ